ncbi:MAG: homoserine dehydrogenase [Chloroflexi bacterium]|nr:homoserine dehydrogenase [Chloroflexota bacterium]
MDIDGKIGIGLLGFGVVGSEVARILVEKSERLAQQVGAPLVIHGILVRDTARPRSFESLSHLTTTNPEDILDSPQVDIVVELMGGEEPATDYLRTALARGKHVVTANKEVMATHGPELIQLAEEQEVNLLYEASVGGGIPIIGPLRKDLLANEVTSLHAIINGTTNYILTRMSQEGTDFQTALESAQELGYAEADPSKDVDGTDAAFKLAILATLAFHTQVVGSDVYREGISRLTSEDFRYARELGYAIKLLAVARREEAGLSLRVHPALVPDEHLLAKVDGPFNAVEIEGDLVGRVVFHGQGAGPRPTGSAVVGDILEVARGIASGRRPIRQGTLRNGLPIVPMEELVTQYYARVTVADRAGVLAQIATVLGELDISIASVIQKNADPANQTAELMIMTHTSREADVREAVRRMEELDVVKGIVSLIRVEHWS